MPTIILNKKTTNPAIPKVPVLGFSDSFDRANTSGLGSSQEGKPWTYFGGTGTNTWQIINNTAGTLALASTSYPHLDAETPDGVYRVRVGEMSQAGGGLSVRIKNGQTMLRVAFRVSSGNNILRLEQFANNVMTTLASSAGKIMSSNQLIEVICSGAMISVKVDGVEQIPPTQVPSEFITATKFGFYGVPTDLGIRYESVEFIPA